MDIQSPPRPPARVLRFPPPLQLIILNEASTGPFVALARVADGIVIETAEGRFLISQQDGQPETLTQLSA
jgi:hypothetical protein